MSIAAVVTAGDREAAKAVYGQNKAYLELGGLSLVARVVAVLQQVPEISAVWLVGDVEKLRAALAPLVDSGAVRKPLHFLEQFENLYQNAWQSYRRLLPGAGPEGRDPASDADRDTAVLYLSGDLPFATPHEISQFVQRGLARRCDYALGLVSDRAMAGFAAAGPGRPGIEPATFNLREGRCRQSNLHLVKPARLGNRHYIESMYEHRHQKELGKILGLAWTLLTSERGGPTVVYYYALMHLAGLADRRGWRRLADAIRRFIPIARIERGLGQLLDAELALVFSDVGGCAIDIDSEEEYDVAKLRFDEWRDAQFALGARIHPLLPAATGSAADPA